jgi:uncharacterized NAD(P)/FAD-binding protein YdhS
MMVADHRGPEPAAGASQLGMQEVTMSFGGVTRVVIVGGGCSGTLLAAELSAASSAHPVEVVVLDPAETPGRGVAYGTRCPSHLLNVPAEQMSAYLNRPAHFAAWAHERDAEMGESSFAPRALYGSYLEHVWSEAQRTAAAGSSLVHVRTSATSVTPSFGGAVLRVALADGGAIEADHVVLAMGNLPADAVGSPGGMAASPRYVADPWRPGALDIITGSVLLIGSGLTAIDVALALDDRAVVGPIRAVSRHGLIPRAHRPGASSVPPMTSAPAGRTIRGLITLLRRRAAERGDWRIAVDELRPHVATLWRSLPDAERRRFLRHASRFWEIHRHRMAPAVAARVDRMMTSHRLSVRAGSIESHRDRDDGVEVVIRRRGSAGLDVFTVSAVVNCTGPQLKVSDAADPLIESLLRARLVRPGPYGLGLDVTTHGAVVGAHGVASQRLWTIGPLRRGADWETTAAREIRAQAVDLALRLAPVRGVDPAAATTLAGALP